MKSILSPMHRACSARTPRADAVHPACACRKRALKNTATAVAALAILAAFAAFGAAADARAEAARPQGAVVVQNGFADLVESVSPAVVSVRVEHDVPVRTSTFSAPHFNFPHGFAFPEGHPMERFFRRFNERRGEQHGQRHNDGHGEEHGEESAPQRRVMGQGSGFFISADGYVVTNHHVIKDGEFISVILHDGTEYDASLVGTDQKTDLALLRLESEEAIPPTPYVAFAEEDTLRVGDWVVAVGNPFGLGGTVTSGIVSGRGRDIGAGPYDDFIQIDAPINRGNSGGPTFDLSGNVVGVNAMIFSPSGGNVGIGFAIPASTAQDVIAELMQDGAVSRGWLGVRVQQVDEDIAANLGLDEVGGALVAEIVSGSPAETAGLRSGDVILGVNGKEIRKPRHLSRLIASLDADTRQELRFWRDGEERNLVVNLGELPDDERLAAMSDTEAEATLGMTLTPAENGLRVLSVAPGSEAARKRISSGDVIIAVGAEPVASGEEFREHVEAARNAGRESVLLLLRRGDTQQYVALPVQRG